MQWVIPLSGRGERFSGYSRKKPFVNVNGQPMIAAVIEQIPSAHNILIVCNHEYQPKLRQLINQPNVTIEAIKQTRGQAETINVATKYLQIDTPFTCIDGDIIISTQLAETISNNQENTVYTFTDEAKTGLYSYLKTTNKTIDEIVEKQPISKIASAGIYSFTSTSDYQKAYSAILGNFEEKYASHVINQLIKQKKHFKHLDVTGQFDCVGTPWQLKDYCIRKTTPKTIVCDLDNTIIYDTNNNPVAISQVKEYINGLHDLGHKIIIHTARGMLSTGNDAIQAESDNRQKVETILKKQGIKYDELIFGKPYADAYIDDKAINSIHDLAQESGFYMPTFETRHFNKVTCTKTQVTKSGSTIKNEIAYYDSIPKKARSLFPTILKSSETKLVMSRNHNPTYSELLLDHKLTSEHVTKLVDALETLHSNTQSDTMSGGWFYLTKLEERLNTNYSFYETYGLVNDLEFILQQPFAFKPDTLIHGDPVFSNIFSGKKIQFIDPRGEVANKLTPYGAPCYDYVKVYQSLSGYDFVLNDIDMPREYLKALQDAYMPLIEVTGLEQKLDSLILSMLPLHQENPLKIRRLIDWYKKR